MKKFLRDTSFVFLFTLPILFLFDKYAVKLSKNVYTEKLAYISSHGSQIKTLLLGNSVAENSFNLLELGDSVYCLAINGRYMYYDIILLERTIHNFENLTTILYPLHYNFYTYPASDYKEYIYSYYKFMHIATPPYTTIFYTSAILTNHFHHSHKPLPDSLRGTDLFTTTWNGQQNKDIPAQSGFDTCLIYMREMARICMERNVRFIVFTPPFPDLYINSCSPQGIANLSRIIDSVRVYHPVEYINYMNHPDFREKHLYANWNHLNKDGATLFAQQVAQDFGL